MTEPLETARKPEPRFEVVSDGGLDRFASLANDVPLAPFSVHFGRTSYLASELPRDAFFRKLRGEEPHPTTSQPTPAQFAGLYQESRRPVLTITISSGLSGSLNSAEQARALAAGVPVTLHDSRTLSGALAFQVHAAMRARELGHSIETALEWVRRVHEETELYFTIDTLEYLRKGGRIGRVQAALGGLLNLRPVVMVDKRSGTYTGAGRARTWSKAVAAIGDRITERFGSGAPLRLGLLYGDATTYAHELLEQVQARHPVLWHDVAPVGVALAVNTGPKAVGVAVAPDRWPWEREADGRA